MGKKLAYDEHTLYGFALPGAVFSVLEQQAQAANCTCSELLQKILEWTYTKEIARQIPLQQETQTNLISVKEYGKLNKRSQEQVKQYLHKNRVPGAVRIDRDWVIPRDSRFPEDHRKAQNELLIQAISLFQASLSSSRSAPKEKPSHPMSNPFSEVTSTAHGHLSTPAGSIRGFRPYDPNTSRPRQELAGQSIFDCPAK